MQGESKLAPQDLITGGVKLQFPSGTTIVDLQKLEECAAVSIIIRFMPEFLQERATDRNCSGFLGACSDREILPL
jgi:hypothetical protein